MHNGNDKRARLRGLLVVLSVAGLILTGCGNDPAPTPQDSGGAASVDAGGDWQEIVTAAEEEGEVVVYTSLTDADKVWDAFHAEYPGIKVTIERAPTADLISRVEQEQAVDSGRADVMAISQISWFRDQSANGHLADLTLSPQAQEDGWEELLGDDTFPTLFAYPFSITWNTDNAEPVESIEEIIEDHPDARVGLFDPEVTPPLSYQYDLWEQAYGDDVMERLSEVQTTVYRSATPMAQSLAAGEIDYALPMTPILGPLLAEGAPIDYVIPDESVVAVPNAAAPLTIAPHPNAAQVFVNWLMGEEGQRLLIEKFDPAAPRLELPGSLTWDQVDVHDPDVWTNEDADEWIATEWAGRF